MNRTEVRSRRSVMVLAVPLGLLLSGLLVWQASYAAFTATTVNAGNSWETGTVSITDDTDGAAMFTEGGLKPGDAGERCVEVTYEGTLDANVKLYAATEGELGEFLQVTVARGTATDAECAGWAPDADLYGPTDFNDLPSTFADGLDDWAPAGDSDATRTYRIAWELPSDVGNGAQGESAEATFTWEAQSR